MTESSQAVTSWVTFQVALAKKFLHTLATTIRHTAFIVVLVMGPFIIGIIALVVVAPLMAPNYGAALGATLVIGQSALIALPLFLARKLVLPDNLLVWRAGLPIRWQSQLIADGCAAAILLSPLFLACLLSASVWFWQWPSWLRPVWVEALLCLLASMFGGWVVGVLILVMRGRSRQGVSFSIGPPVGTDADKQNRPGWRWWRILYDLILRPVWRTNSLAWQLLHCSMLFVAAGCIAVMGLAEPMYVAWRVGFSLLLATLVIGLTLWRDAVMQTNHALLLDQISAWPVSFSRLSTLARLWAILPSIAFAAFFLIASLWRLVWGLNAAVFFGLLLAGPYATLALSKVTSRGRAGFASCLWALLIISGYSL